MVPFHKKETILLFAIFLPKNWWISKRKFQNGFFPEERNHFPICHVFPQHYGHMYMQIPKWIRSCVERNQFPICHVFPKDIGLVNANSKIDPFPKSGSIRIFAKCCFMLMGCFPMTFPAVLQLFWIDRERIQVLWQGGQASSHSLTQGQTDRQTDRHTYIYIYINRQLNRYTVYR